MVWFRPTFGVEDLLLEALAAHEEDGPYEQYENGVLEVGHGSLGIESGDDVVLSTRVHGDLEGLPLAVPAGSVDHSGPLVPLLWKAADYGLLARPAPEIILLGFVLSLDRV